MKHAPQYGYHAARQPAPNPRAETSLLKRLTAMVDAQVSKDADRARQFLDAQKGKP
jgi:hypothetical protein